MKKKLCHLFLCCLLFLVLTPSLRLSAASEDTGKQVDVLFLHDTHSHLNSFLTVEDGQDVTLGGFAKIQTLINQAKKDNPNALVLDAGEDRKSVV